MGRRGEGQEREEGRRIGRGRRGKVVERERERERVRSVGYLSVRLFPSGGRWRQIFSFPREERG